MIILNTDITPQTFKAIFRETPAIVTMKLTDRNLNTSVIFTNVVPDYQYGWAEITETFNLIEDREYVIEISVLQDVIYRGLVYCTSQSDYSKFQMTDGDVVTSNPKDTDIILF